MLGRLRTAAKFFTLGLAIGLMFAPGSGEETRRKLIDKITSPIRRRQGHME